MIAYNEMTDEQLAELAQNGDDEAFTTVFRRYEKALKIQARKANLQYPSYYEDDFFDYFQEQLMKMIKTYKVGSGIFFASFFKFKLPRLAYNYTRGHLEKRVYKEGGRYTGGKVVITDEPAARDKYKVITSDLEKTVMPDNRYTYEYQQEVKDTELYAYLSAKSPQDAKVMALLVRGLTYDEIATEMGRKGNYQALTQWGYRAVQRVRQHTVSFYRKSDSLDEITSYVKAL
jgi:DNA-directed RNA polymerase specialized sigma24 family protein